MSEEKIVVIDKRKSVLESFYKDFVTFSLLAFCIYISQGSTFWTFVTGLLFLLFTFAKISIIMKRHNVFKSKKELLDWANKLDDA